MDEDGCCSFPIRRHIFCEETVAEHFSKDFAFGLRRRRWWYSRRSLPGAEFDIDRSLVEISSGEGGENKECQYLQMG